MGRHRPGHGDCRQQSFADAGAGEEPVHFPGADFFSDGVHPSELTYKIWAEDMSRFIIEEKELFDEAFAEPIAIKEKTPRKKARA